MNTRLHRSPFTTVFAALTLAAGLAACGDNPAADAPAAEVGEATEAPAAAGAPAAGAVTYTLAEDSQVAWNASKVTRSHDGAFPDVEGTITLVEGRPEASSVEVNIDTTTLTSDTDQLTTHLKSADFFDVEQYPEASFRSTQITPQGDGSYQVTGVLDMHGQSKEITFPATIEVSGDTVRTQAEFSIDRYDWGIDYKGAADDLIRDEVLLRFDLVAEREGGADAAADTTGG